jgi:glycosyltransferase involved in cell wall biosynthesis
LKSQTPHRQLDSLLVISHVTHFAWKGHLYAYGPYAREIDVWADLFGSLVIAAPCRQEEPPGDATAFTRSNIRIEPQIEAGGDTLFAKIRLAVVTPALLWSLARAIRRADAVHVRCPGNLGLLGALVAPLLCRYRVAKYAGQWPSYPGQTLANSVQKRVLRSHWWRAPVTVYGQWPGEPSHIVPFFTSVLNQGQMRRARIAAGTRRFDERPLRVLYVGQLGQWKNVDSVVRAVARLAAQGVAVELDLVGDGPARSQLEQLVTSLGVARVVRFAGGVSADRVLDYYERSHVLVLASRSEGWPKAIAEGMAFGLICVGSDRGLLPQMLGDGRGFIVPAQNDDALAEALSTIATSRDRFPDMRVRAAAWGQRYSLEDLQAALAELLTASWGVRVTSPSPMAADRPVARYV